jgi:hypothetical protein
VTHRSLFALATVLSCVACRSGGARVSGSIGSSARPLPPEVVAAETALRDSRPADAEAILLRAGGVSTAAPERSWLLLELWKVRCAAERARVAADALPPDAMGAVLQAHVRADPAVRMALLRPWLDGRGAAGPAEGWAELAAAVSFAEEGDRHDAVSRHAAAAARLGPAYVAREAYLLAGRDALEDQRPAEAERLGGRAAAVDPADARSHTLRSQAAFRVGRIADATRAALEALLRQPRSARAARRVADLVREDPGADVEADVRLRVAPLVSGTSVGSETLALYALLLDRAGDRTAAIAGYRRALAGGANPVPVARRFRRLLFAAGARREALGLLLEAVPPDVVHDPRNLLRGAWAAIETAAAQATDGPAPAADLERLAHALVAVGAVEDAAKALDGGGGGGGTPSPAGAALSARLRAEVEFQKAIREAVEEGYRAKAQKKEPPSLGALLARVRALARRHLPPDEATALERVDAGSREFPFLGAWLDHSTDTAAPLVARFRRHGKYLMIGQRSGSPPEAILLSLASITRRQEIATQGRRFAHDVAIGYDREIRAYVDFRGGDLSGACLPDGVWLDADSSRKEEHDLALASRVDPALAERLDRVAGEPPAVDGIDGPFAMDDPGCLSLRLVRRHLATAGPRAWGAFDVLRAHEFGHVLDIRRHLPVVKGLPATVALLASEGFSTDRVEARLEGRAQRAALIDSRYPALALAEMVRALPLFERSPEVHEWGYREQVAAILRFVEGNAARFPRIDVSRKILPQLDRLTDDEIRFVARSLAGLPPAR